MANKIKVRTTIIPNRLENSSNSSKVFICFSMFFSFEIENDISPIDYNLLVSFPDLISKIKFSVSTAPDITGTFKEVGNFIASSYFDKTLTEKYWTYLFNDPRVKLNKKVEKHDLDIVKKVFFSNPIDVVKEYNELYSLEAFTNNFNPNQKSILRKRISDFKKEINPDVKKNIDLIKSLEKKNDEVAITANDVVYFNDLLSHFSDYPTVLAKLNILIKDIKVEVSLSDISLPNKLIKINPESTTHGLYDIVSDNISTNFELVNRINWFKPKVNSPLYDGGFVKLNDNTKYSLEQYSVAETSVKSELFATEQIHSSSLPTRNSKGFYLIEFKKADDLKYLHRTEAEIKSTGLFLEDLIAGYRYDMVRNNSEWYSLHEKCSAYSFKLKRELDIEETLEEGWSQIDQANSTDTNSILFSDYICHYTGWSLSVDNPLQRKTQNENNTLDSIRTTSIDTQDELEKYLFEKTEIKSKSKPNSLPKLRFNDKYKLRARVVTIDGESIPLNNSTDNYSTAKKEYKRIESTVAPSFVPREQLKTIKKNRTTHEVIENSISGKEGESEYIFVIRSQDNNSHTKEKSRRGIAPPEIVWQVAEWHKFFDDSNGKLDIPKLVAISDFLPDYDIKTKQWKEGTGKFKELFDTRLNMPYLSDPMCQGFEIICDANNYYSLLFDNGHTDMLFFNDKNNWPEKVSVWDFVVQELRGNKTPKTKKNRNCILNIHNHNKTIKIYISKGEDLKFKIRSFPIEIEADKSPFELLSSVNNLIVKTPSIQSESKTVKFLKSARNIRSNHLFGEKEFRVIHAVKKPLHKPKFLDETFIKRTWNPNELTYALLSSKIFFPGKTARTIELYAKFIEEEIVLNEYKLDPNFKNEHGEKEKVFDYFLEAKIQKKSNSVWEIGTVVPYAELNIKETNIDLEKTFYALHNLKDTKAHKIEYTLVATSRFTEFYPATTKPNEFKIESEKQTVIIPASKAPELPKVIYPIPLVDKKWQKNKSIQIGNKIRIYFDRGWFSSGFGEKIAVVLSSDPNNQREDWLKSFVSSWGRDVTTYGQNLSPISLANFKNTFDKKEGLTIDHPNFKKRNINNISQECSSPFSAAIYEIHPYPNAQNIKSWFVDIEFDGLDAYFPFIKLSLARYQENAIPFEELSSTTLCDFIQVAPNRTVTLTRNGEQIEIQLFAPKTKLNRKNLSSPEISNVVYIGFVPLSDFNHEASHQVVYKLNDTANEYDINNEVNWFKVSDKELIEEGAVWKFIKHIKSDKYKIIIKEFEVFGNSDETDNPDLDSDYRLIYGTTLNS